jgi:hypothetical protein
MKKVHTILVDGKDKTIGVVREDNLGYFSTGRYILTEARKNMLEAFAIENGKVICGFNKIQLMIIKV